MMVPISSHENTCNLFCSKWHCQDARMYTFCSCPGPFTLSSSLILCVPLCSISGGWLCRLCFPGSWTGRFWLGQANARYWEQIQVQRKGEPFLLTWLVAAAPPPKLRDFFWTVQCFSHFFQMTWPPKHTIPSSQGVGGFWVASLTLI